MIGLSVKLARGLAPVGNVWDIDWKTSRTFCRIFWPDLGKVGEHEATLTCRSGMVVHPGLHVGTVVHLYRVLKARSPSGWNYSVVLSFYTHGRMDDGL